ncbi:MAG: cupin domain-containing protein [Myxococcales bacterium]|nr:cupin domain-containing protein [Myxococcales bacterium]
MLRSSDLPLHAEDIITRLGLEPHPKEGGFFRETYRAKEAIDGPALPDRYGSPRAHGTAIYYLLTPDTRSHLHRLTSDEVFHFYLGDPCEMLQLDPEGASRVVTLGPDLLAGESPQILVPRSTWQGMRLVPGGSVALLGCTVSPGFDFVDYEHGDRAALLARWPEHKTLIEDLTEI